jgi:hypothetical protein
VGPREIGQLQQEHMGDLSSSGLGDSIQHLLAKVTMPHGLECPQEFMPLGPVSHLAEQATLDLAVVHRWP